MREVDGALEFTRDKTYPSPSTAAGVVAAATRCASSILSVLLGIGASDGERFRTGAIASSVRDLLARRRTLGGGRSPCFGWRREVFHSVDAQLEELVAYVVQSVLHREQGRLDLLQAVDFPQGFFGIFHGLSQPSDALTYQVN